MRWRVIQIAQLSNEFYHLMPRSGFEFERIPILDTSDEVQKEWKNVETLLELEIASKIMAGALYRIKGQSALKNDRNTVSVDTQWLTLSFVSSGLFVPGLTTS